MKKRYAIFIGLALGIVGSLVGFATIARTAQDPQPYGAPIGPKMSKDTGPGELLVAVVGGAYATKEEAEAANQQLAFGDVQGYYVVPVAQFSGLRQQLGQPGEFVLVSLFRTSQGAQEFAAFAQSTDVAATILPLRVTSFGGAYAGLGQEANPDGSGPLLGPTEESLPQQSAGETAR
jgi:hypothetical protein